MPAIPPTYLNNIYITDFQEKADLFNNFFSKQCSPIESESTLHNFELVTNNVLEDVVSFSEDDITNIIKTFFKK